MVWRGWSEVLSKALGFGVWNELMTVNHGGQYFPIILHPMVLGNAS